MSLFRAGGVDFSGTGKQVFVYDRHLRVRATLEDLDEIVQIIQVLNASPPQVSIEILFCEMTERAALELSSEVPGLLTRPEASVPGVQNTGTSILTDTNFQKVIQALKQKQGVNLLTTPKVTTVSGRQAQIKAVNIRYIVTDLDLNYSPLVDTNQKVTTSRQFDTNQMVSIQPLAEPMELGPIIDLVPTVMADGLRIQMTATASIKEFLGYDNKEEFIASVRRGGAEPITQITPLPRFRVRQVTTSAVVSDSQTLLLVGGTTIHESAVAGAPSNVTTSSNAGNAAQGQGQTESKRLLVFITPTIIDPAGNRVHSAK